MKILTLLILFTLLLQSTVAFQVSPAKSILDEEGNVTFTLRHTGQVFISFEGELAAYARGPSELHVEGTQEVEIFLSPPELPPGSHELLVIFRTLVGSGELGSSAELAPKIMYRVSFDGPYVVAYQVHEPFSQPLVVSVSFENLGSEAAYFSPEFTLGEASYSRSELVLPPLDTQKKRYSLSHEAGEYTLQSTFLDTVIEETVTVGKPTYAANITDIRVGEIGAIDLSLAASWNVPIETRVRAKIQGDGTEWLLEPRDVVLDSTSEVTFFWEAPSDDAQEITLMFEYGAGEITLALIAEEETKNHVPIFLIVLVICAILLLLWRLLFKNK